MNPDDGNVATTWDSLVAAKVNAAIATLSASLPVGSSLELTALGGLVLHMGGTDYVGMSALAPWLNFANFSITAATGPVYDAVGELLMAAVGDHYIAGDGRANENFGLTSLHHVFHENHNVQLVNLETHILESPDAVARNGFQLAVNDSLGGISTIKRVTTHCPIRAASLSLRLTRYPGTRTRCSRSPSSSTRWNTSMSRLTNMRGW